MITSRTTRWISILASSLLALGVLVTDVTSSQPPDVAGGIPPDDSLSFVENRGQFPPEARFRGYGASPGPLWLADDAVWVVAQGQDRSTVLRLTFPGANAHPQLEPFGRQDTVFNYYQGDDPANWHPALPVWGGVRYVDLYPGVDLEIVGRGKSWIWRLACEAGDAFALRDVRLRIEGADAVTRADDALRLTTPAGDLTLPLLAVNDIPRTQPSIVEQGVAYHVTAPFASPVTSQPPHSNTQYATRTSPHVSHDVPADLLFGTFLGGEGDDEAHALAVNDDGEVILTGNTYSPGFPTTPGAFDPAFDGESEIFVARLTADGGDLAYATFLGGTSAIEDRPDERAWDVAVDGDGAAHITGETHTDDFPTTPGAFDTTYNPGYDLPEDPPEANPFYTQLDSSGALAYSTYLGPTSEGKGIAVDGTGMVYVVGRTGSEWFPTTEGAYDRSLAFSGDFFVLKLDPAGQGQNDLRYSTYVGMTAQDWPQDIAVDETGAVYVIGSTEGAFPTTTGAYDTTFNGTLPCQAIPCPRSVVFFQIDPAGNGTADLLYATYLGGSATINEQGLGVAVDAAGIAYLTGNTWAEAFPTTPGAFDTTYNGYGDAFVSQLNPAGNGAADLLYATYLGGSYIEWGSHDVTVDERGDVYVVGATYSDDFPVTSSVYQSGLQDYVDVTVSRLRPQGNGPADLVYSTYLGGDYVDDGYAIAVGPEETVYVAGRTASSDFPSTAGAYDTTFGGGTCGASACDDAFVAHLRVEPRYVITGTLVDPEGEPILAVPISAGADYQGATNTRGEYTIADLEPGEYLLTPQGDGYFFLPETRRVTIPPSATGQDFTGYHILKESTAPRLAPLDYGDVVTYTVRLLYANDRDVVLYDPVPTYTTYISGSLHAPAGVAYDPATEAISGSLHLTASTSAIVTFAVQVEITGTAESAPFILNRACVHPMHGGLADCLWSNEVLNNIYGRSIYLPLVLTK